MQMETRQLVSNAKVEYSCRKLLIPSISPRDWKERYHIVDFRAKLIHSIAVDNTRQQFALIQHLRKIIPVTSLPYGYTRYEDLIPHLLQPHGVLRNMEASSAAYISYNKAPYLGRFDLNTGERTLFPREVDINYDDVFCSTGHVDSEGKIYMSVSSLTERLVRKSGCAKSIAFRLCNFNINDEAIERETESHDGLVDAIHQVGRSGVGFLVLLDMNLAVDYDFSLADENGETITHPAFAESYLKSNFGIGRMFLVDIQAREIVSFLPPAPTPAHVEFDPFECSIFYVSCHNISKIRSHVAIHGPAIIAKFQYSNRKLVLLSLATSEDMLRITTHRAFIHQGKAIIAVTGYPNLVFLIDGETMEIQSRVELFSSQSVNMEGLYVCPSDDRVALYLEVSEDGKFLFATGSRFVYVIDVTARRVVEALEYTVEPVVATSHIAFI